ncbi:hypothetical protein HB943_14250 [Listeria weihenstephanensis]|uniref:Uncharacterized protein n=1 Tax=Listeria weihenstephanensis TaxID=1006155 RepID=A0A841Z8Y4_9LIST|nr:hypothetical protein [Listeria weihenstephanensis]MBC1501765.1 hypothetical protein [Listeria weihenstephanensis]
MGKWLFNTSLFTGALLLSIGILRNSLLLTAIALVLAVIAQYFYRKKYPKRNRSFKEIVAEQKSARK